MPEPTNIVLYAATYDDATAAAEDFTALQVAGADEGLALLGAVVMSRDADGTVEVVEHGDGRTAAGSVLGGGAGLVVGLFAPPLLLSTAIGAGIGAVLGHLAKRHEERRLGEDLEEYLPPGASAVVVLAEDVYLDRVQAALGKAVKRISKAVDAEDYDTLAKALQKSEKELGEALDS